MFKVGDKVRCVFNGGWASLTEGKVYEVVGPPSEYPDIIRVVHDDGEMGGYLSHNFELVAEEKPKQYFVSDNDELNWDIVDSLDSVPPWADRVWELGDELVKTVKWEKKDA